MATKTTKLAGPDSKGNYKVLSVTNHLGVKPGEVYTERYVRNHIMHSNGPNVTIVQPKYEGMVEKQRKCFTEKPVNHDFWSSPFAEEVDGSQESLDAAYAKFAAFLKENS